MDESDDDFKELCASFFQRVKRTGTKEVLGERKTQESSNSTEISVLKKTKQSATKSKTLPGTLKKPRSCSQAPRAKKQGPSKSQEGEPAPPVSGDGGVLAPALNQAVLQDQAQSIQTANAPNDDSQPSLSCLTTTAVPSPSKPRTAELVLQRMQQFKRAHPERLRHASQACSLEATLEENDPQNPQEEMVAGNGNGPGLPATDSDATVALVLQQEFGREGTSAQDDGLEAKGLFFCQMCQKNLSAMNVTRREQHVNRCLDEAEKALGPSMPQIPECPICGKLFTTSKSRISHLKQCAVRMGVGPQLLLQAVRMQTAPPEASSSPLAPSFSNLVGGGKRKAATNKKEPRKRRKVDKPEVPSEDLLVAMALSRSEMEQGPPVPALRLESAFSERMRPGAEKKSRKKKALVSPPQLLVQDADTTGRQIEDRVAQLLSEEVELSSTPPLPVSRLLRDKLEEAGWRLQEEGRKGNFLWEGSALTGAWALESFYTVGLVPPIVPQQPTKGLTQEPKLTQSPPALHSSSHAASSPRDPSLSASQREQQALQDLVDLAEEGLSASPWPCSRGLACSGEAAGLDLVPSSLPLTGFVLPPEEKPLERDSHTSLSLGLLAADFGAMVNNPHLSDVQFQTDSGEVVYAHKFVLYARCPLLIQYVNNEGFSAIEDGDETQRVLLSSVSTEAACVFLRYLYTADAGLLPHLAADLGTLARRFGVSDLARLCEQVPAVMGMEGEWQEEKEAENCESRVENFQELLRSMWADDEEEAETLLKSEEDREKVNEADMEEIYEFAATQRKLLQQERAPDTDEEPGQPGEDSPSAGSPPADVLGSKQLEKGDQLELLGLQEYKSPVCGKDAGLSLLLPAAGCSDRAAGAETRQQTAPKEAPGPSSCSAPGACKAGRDLVHSCEVPAYERVFLSPQGEFSEMSQIANEHQEQGDAVRKKEVDMACTPAPQLYPCCPASWLPGDRSPSRSQLHLPHTGDASPPAPRPHGVVPTVSSPSSRSPALPSKQDSDILTVLKEPGHWRGRGCRSILERKNKGVLISPEKSPPIDLTQSVPDPASSTSQGPASQVSGENEIILLLDSDEELELEQTKAKLVSNGPTEERNVLEVSHRSSELFPVIDVDADQEHSQSPPRREAELETGEGQLENQGIVGSTRASWLISDRESSLDEDSTTDASWLVPATPLISRSRDCSSQTQITSLRARPAEDKMAQPSSRATPENSPVSEATQKFSVITPLMSPMPPGTSGRGRQVHRSPSRSQSRHHKLSSPRASCPAAGGLPDITGPVHKHSPKQAAVSEVVEVGDSEDEQEVASHRVNRSPLLDSEPPIPVDDCWSIEPLSPIPIDHLNLERTGPLSTSSPSSQAQEPLDHGDCHSPGLLGSTPIRASGTARRASPEQSSGAGSPGGSRLSFLNPALWEDWEEEGQKSPEAPAAHTPGALRAQKSDGPETPSANRKKNLPPKVPITPMPRYSIMETPVLKKELDRFGVRPLPKRQMVLKLKEIFQYTHQTLESDSEDEIQSSQVPQEWPCSQTLPTETYKPSRVGGCTPLEATEGPSTQKSKGPQHRKKQPGQSIPHRGSRPPAEKPPPGSDVDTQLPASQESTATSVDSSDTSFSSQSSSCEFGATFESVGDEEEDEGAGVSASQATSQAPDTEEAVRRYIRSRPALYRKVLMYQPLELSELQAELKRDGIRVAMGKLLDTLDALCITFTTAAARKEKLKQKGQQQRGRKKGERD
ncbi:PREDICTED: structure-specific endonuclease subunit SLX4 isoform X2 [Chinchilla lanigera]|uniref:structure-specific endonuclease subunit SLX4 isoform X2 n=1 Tax=Chinchilla lanigera TaxID=34839 RepID=UPI00038F0370|nr:PREDICTED: structure-specific endonuclease subunit SLX4 isoform X2 [Chinchilla lanigera]